MKTVGDAAKKVEAVFNLLILDRQDCHEILQASREGRMQWFNESGGYVEIYGSYISRISDTHITINGVEMTHAQYNTYRGGSE